MYLPLDLHSPVAAEGMGRGEDSRPEFVQQTIEQLEDKKVQYLLWSERLDYADQEHPADDHLGPLRAYLRDHYHRTRVFADQDVVLERK
jgi:hypothetical protein